ncbi:MAG: hypothetical protein H7101_12120 [Deinococcales bacterium]|nr:hypothetical protein [Chitinophagaceae bacterium]
MATVLIIDKKDKKKVITKKVAAFINQTELKKGFPASKFTGKITCFGDGLVYQKKMRDEWE